MVLRVKKTTLYAERDEVKRQDYLEELARLNPLDIVYMDETGIDESLSHHYARSPRGKPVFSNILGRKKERTSIIAAWVSHAKEFIAPFVFNGYTDGKRFNQWLEKCLIPQLRPGQVVVMDNAAFHKTQLTRELIEKAGCKLLYLPPYSPDFNPIEKQWANLKRKYKTFKQRGYEHHNAIDAAFLV